MHIQTAALLDSMCPIDIYLSCNNGQITDWPHRLASYKEASLTQRQHSLNFMIDSGKEDSGGTATEVLDEAERLHPTHIMATDTISPTDSELREDREAIVETAARTAAFLDEYERRDVSATIIIPLQPPHDEHYLYLLSEYPRQAEQSYFALGGLKDASPESQLEALRDFREVAGYQVDVHGLGFGSSNLHIEAFSENPALVDSIDLSTAKQNIQNGELWDDAEIPVPQGDHSLSVQGRYVTALTIHLAQRYGTLFNDTDTETITELTNDGGNGRSVSGTDSDATLEMFATEDGSQT